MINDWLNGIEVGMWVIVSGGGPMGRDSAHKVERLTKTQVIISGSSDRYRRDGGRQVGGSQWRSTYLREATKEALEKVQADARRRDLMYKISCINWKARSLDDLESIWAAIDKRLSQGADKLIEEKAGNYKGK